MPPQQVGGGHGRGALTAPGESLAKPGKQKISKKDSWLCVTQDKKDSYQPVCNVPVITSLKEEERLIESSTKVYWDFRGIAEGHGLGVSGRWPSCSLPSQPVVKLLYNRSNNKYSYTR